MKTNCLNDVKKRRVKAEYQSVKIGVSAGVERIEEDEEDLGVSNADERVTGHGRQSKEGDGRPTGKVGKDE